MKKFIFVIFVYLTVAMSATAKADDLTFERISDYLHWSHHDTRFIPKYEKKAAELIPALLHWSEVYNPHKDGIDFPLLVACLWYKESSWRNFKGARGELGPGQVMPGKWVQHDLSTLDGQIAESIRQLSEAVNNCDTMIGVFTWYAYGGGTCVPRTEKTRMKMRHRENYYRNAFEMFGVSR